MEFNHIPPLLSDSVVVIGIELVSGNSVVVVAVSNVIIVESVVIAAIV
jgi:hypothetical protein